MDYNFNIIGSKYLQEHTVILPWDLGKWRRWSWFHPQDVTALYHVAFLATVLCASACVCVCARARALWLTCVCVCSQLYWHFLKRGWHFQGIWRFDPFCVWRVVCCPPHNTEGNAAAVPAACPAFGALLYSIWNSSFLLTRSVIGTRPALYIACLFRDDWFTAWSFT